MKYKLTSKSIPTTEINKKIDVLMQFKNGYIVFGNFIRYKSPICEEIINVWGAPDEFGMIRNFDLGIPELWVEINDTNYSDNPFVEGIEE